MRTLEIIEKDLTMVQENLKPIQEMMNDAVDAVKKLYDEVHQYKLDNNLFTSIEELKKHCGKYIDSILLVEKTDEGLLKTDDMYGYEYFKVDNNGHLNYSSEFGGVMEYDEKLNAYSRWNYHRNTHHNYIGYLEIEFGEEDD
ncbi:hypothetical protein [uncultured Robinsoniella sp.]|uniref:hypothetical protein n=1 Tax=uncultured Robinsoniella sp. TaxID=904190 RepID=UPI0020460DA0|nr:MAG TPA: hypothetical protein [Caudoviricetes sp.]